MEKKYFLRILIYFSVSTYMLRNSRHTYVCTMYEKSALDLKRFASFRYMYVLSKEQEFQFCFSIYIMVSAKVGILENDVSPCVNQRTQKTFSKKVVFFFMDVENCM